MFVPPKFREDNIDKLHELIRKNPFATLVTLGSNGITANHIPFVLKTSSEHGELGCLQGHVALANPVWKDFQPDDVLVIFQGLDAYITPSWYPSKREHGKVVPTWNYMTVHANGKMSTTKDAQWLTDQISALTHQHESNRSEPWAVSDAPADFIDSQVKGIVGIEIAISELVGKSKLSQNRSAADRAGVVLGLRGELRPMADEIP
jgi:transcriptional regulator